MTTREANDTPPEIADVMVDRWRAMSPYERVLLADHLSVDVASFATAAIRLQNPGIGDGEVSYELTRRRYGSALADAAYGRTADA